MLTDLLVLLEKHEYYQLKANTVEVSYPGSSPAGNA